MYVGVVEIVNENSVLLPKLFLSSSLVPFLTCSYDVIYTRMLLFSNFVRR